jgi:Uma2 family endonuclease
MSSTTGTLQNLTATQSAEERDRIIAELNKLGATGLFGLVDGKVILKGGNPKLAYLKTELVYALDSFLKEHPVARLFANLSLRLFPDDGRQLRTPDLSLYRAENCPKIGDELPTFAPDLAIEILTHDDPFFIGYTLDNVDLYLSKGSKVVWIVIPAKACVWIWTSRGRRWEYETLTCPEVMPDWSLDLKKFFSTINEYEIEA